MGQVRVWLWIAVHASFFRAGIFLGTSRHRARSAPAFRMTEQESDQDGHQRRHFAKSGLNRENWFNIANGLVTSMRMLEPSIESYFEILATGDPSKLPKYDHFFTLLMLGGYAIENLCKGHLVTKLTKVELEHLRASGKFPCRLTTHLIEDYIKDVGLEISSTETELLKRVSQAVYWRGRYPIPKSPEEMGPAISMRGDMGRLFKMIDRLRHQVDAPS